MPLTPQQSSLQSTDRAHLCPPDTQSLCSGVSHLQTSHTSLLCLDDPEYLLMYHLPKNVEFVQQTLTVLRVFTPLNPLNDSELTSVYGLSFEDA